MRDEINTQTPCIPEKNYQLNLKSVKVYLFENKLLQYSLFFKFYLFLILIVSWFFSKPTTKLLN